MRQSSIWLAGAFMAASLTSWTVRPALADELDALLLVKEAQPLRERWEECAAAFARPRLKSNQTAERIAADAFRNCQSREAALRSFVAKRIGRRKADGVILLLREQYRSDLSAAIEETRSRD